MASMYMCYTSDAGVSRACFSTTVGLKRLLTGQRVHLVGKTKGVKLVHSMTSTMLRGKKRIAKMVPRFVMSRK